MAALEAALRHRNLKLGSALLFESEPADRAKFFYSHANRAFQVEQQLALANKKLAYAPKEPMINDVSAVMSFLLQSVSQHLNNPQFRQDLARLTAKYDLQPKP